MDEGLKAGGVKVAGMSFDFVADNSNQPEGGSKSNVDTGTTREQINNMMKFLRGLKYLVFSWEESGVSGCGNHGPWLIRNAPFILRKWTLKLSHGVSKDGNYFYFLCPDQIFMVYHLGFFEMFQHLPQMD
ncbi:hypothetical protein Tco_1487479 [Tanacetum coccineum]